MVRTVKWAFILILVLVPGAALAEIYYWVDGQGNQNYTTRLESIPEPYRAGAQLLDVPKGPPPPPELPPTPAAGGVTRISFVTGSPVLVSARINGAGPVNLILDTGADRTMVSPSVLSRFGISTENAPRALIKGVTGTSYGEAVWVESVEVGEAKAGPLLIIAHDVGLAAAEGLLGRDFLSLFHVTIDSKEQVVTLSPN
jgi:hypothetical protein